MSEVILKELESVLQFSTTDLINTQVKLNSLFRIHEMLLKLHGEFPSRIDQIRAQIDEIEILETKSKSRLLKLAEMEETQIQLEQQFGELKTRFSNQQEFQSLSIFQKEKMTNFFSNFSSLVKNAYPVVEKDARIIADKIARNEENLVLLNSELDKIVAKLV